MFLSYLLCNEHLIKFLEEQCFYFFFPFGINLPELLIFCYTCFDYLFNFLIKTKRKKWIIRGIRRSLGKCLQTKGWYVFYQPFCLSAFFFPAKLFLFQWTEGKDTSRRPNPKHGPVTFFSSTLIFSLCTNVSQFLQAKLTKYYIFIRPCWIKALFYIISVKVTPCMHACMDPNEKLRLWNWTTEYSEGFYN